MSLTLALPLLTAAHAAQVYDDESLFLADPAWPACETAIVTGFEDAPLATYVEDRYASLGFTLEASSAGAVVDDDVAGTLCRGERCARAPIIEGYGASFPTWLKFDFVVPTPVLSFWLIDFGTEGSGQVASVTAYYDGKPVDSIQWQPGGDDVDGGVFVGLVFSSLVDEVYVSAEVPGDGIGVDDIRFAPAACNDGDGDGLSEYLGDCNDADAAVYPGAVEACDGKITSCVDRLPDRELDGDSDGWMDCHDTDGDGIATADGDCAPWDDTSHPGAAEICDGRDNACVGAVDDTELDADFDSWIDCVDTDGDGVTTASGDCDPWDQTSYPGAPELCDGRDNACAGAVPVDEIDDDEDGFVECDGDCNDADPERFPGATEPDNGVDYDCDGRSVGAQIGCSHGDFTPPPARLLLLLVAAGALVARRARRLTRPVVAATVALLSLPAIAAISGAIGVFSSIIETRGYQNDLARTNHGRQIVLQVSEHAANKMLLDYFAAHADLLEAEQTWAVPLKWPPYTQDFAFRIWLRDASLRFMDNETVVLRLDVEGYLHDLSGALQPATMSGQVVLSARLDLDDDPSAGRTLLWLRDIDVAPNLEIEGYLGTSEFEVDVNSNVANVFKGAIADFNFDVSAIHQVSKDPDMAAITANDGDYALDWGVRNLAFKTIKNPLGGSESLVMVGADIVNLPVCFATAAESAEYDLFYSDAWDNFEANLIEPGQDVAVSISTRLLNRLMWNLTWNQDVYAGLTTLEATKWIEAGCGTTGSTDREYDVNWDGFLTTTPVYDLDEPRCDGLSDGGQVLSPLDGIDPWFHEYWHLHVDHGAGFDSHLFASAQTRLYIDNGASDAPHLAVNEATDVQWNPTSLVKIINWVSKKVMHFFKSIHVTSWDGDFVGGANRWLDTRFANLAAQFSRSFLTLDRTVASHWNFRFQQMTAHPATLTFSGLISSPDVPSEWARAWEPPVGTILGLNAVDAGDPVAAGGQAALQGLCPPGYVARAYVIGDNELRWCEYGDDARAGSLDDLVDGAWCGIDVHPRNRPEICDNRDNDGDGEVDETFTWDKGWRAPDGDLIADCYGVMGGKTSTTDDDSFPVDYEGSCDGYAPREECPPGFHPFRVWIDGEYGAAVTYPRGTTPLTLDEINREADLVTCVAESGPDPDSLEAVLPEGLVRLAWVRGYSLNPGTDCPSGWQVVEQAAALGPRYGYAGADLGAAAGRLQYCAAPGDGGDADGDGLVRATEVEADSDPSLWSTDGDLLPDGLELDLGFDPIEEDTDGDDLSDLTEWLVLGTDAAAADTGDDGLPDGYEIWVTFDDPTNDDSDDDGVLDGDEESLQDIDDDWYEGLSPDGEPFDPEGDGDLDPGDLGHGG
jgi:hypothetical protein